MLLGSQLSPSSLAGNLNSSHFSDIKYIFKKKLLKKKNSKYILPKFSNLPCGQVKHKNSLALTGKSLSTGKQANVNVKPCTHLVISVA